MKWEYFVYARGIEQNDGFKMRAGPEYVNKDVIKGCQGFFSTRERFRTFEEELSASGINEEFAVNNTFVFLPIEKYRCCLLMRAAMVESPETREYYTDFQDRPVWSLEGLCCPYERLTYFFASLPTLLLWFKAHERSSLCTLNSSKRISGTIEPQEELVFDPISGEMPSITIPGASENYMNAVKRLCSMIAAAGEPFPFVFGALSEQIFRTVGSAYRISEFIPITNTAPKLEAAADFGYSPIKLRQDRPVGIKKSYVLKLGIDMPAGSYTWHIAEQKPNAQEIVLSSRPVTFDSTEGISMLKLMAEAELIRELAVNMGWSTEPFSNDYKQVYCFTKEV